MKDILLLVDLWPLFKVLLALATFFLLLDKCATTQLSKWLIKGIEKAWKNFPFWWKKVCTESELHHSLLNMHNPRKKIHQWISNRIIFSVFVLLAGNMYIYSFVFFCLAPLPIFSPEPSILKFVLAFMLAYCFWRIARFYKADAYNLADKYGINIYPWR